jgi:hypothetical protein
MNANPKPGRTALFVVVACGAATSSANAQNTSDRVGRQCETIRADQGWQRTGVTVRPTDFICVAADGLWSHGRQGIQEITPFYGPEGFAKDDPVSIPEVVSRVGALIGKIGENAPFVIERQLCFIPAATGELMLSMNDLPGAFGNNVGSMHVQIARWPASSIPNRVQLQPQACRSI